MNRTGFPVEGLSDLQDAAFRASNSAFAVTRYVWKAQTAIEELYRAHTLFLNPDGSRLASKADRVAGQMDQ